MIALRSDRSGWSPTAVQGASQQLGSWSLHFRSWHLLPMILGTTQGFLLTVVIRVVRSVIHRRDHRITCYHPEWVPTRTTVAVWWTTMCRQILRAVWRHRHSSTRGMQKPILFHIYIIIFVITYLDAKTPLDSCARLGNTVILSHTAIQLWTRVTHKEDSSTALS